MGNSFNICSSCDFFHEKKSEVYIELKENGMHINRPNIIFKDNINSSNNNKVLNNSLKIVNQNESNKNEKNIEEEKKKDIEELKISIHEEPIKNIKEAITKSASKKEKDNENKLIELQKRENELKEKENFIKNKLLEIQKREKDIILREKNQLKFEQNINQIIEKEIQKRNKTILIGLNNIGATCYMNSTLQCLSNTKDLTDYFLNIYKDDSNKKMANEYHQLILNLWNREKNNIPYSPYSFKEVLSRENPLFAGIAANDSKDLINFLLERFHQELNSIKRINNNNKILSVNEQINEQYMLNSFIQEMKENYNSPISHLFYGIMETKSKCLGCNTIKYNFQIYSFLEFPLQQVNKYYYDKGERQLINNDGKNPDVDLYECFEYYRKIDLMSGENQMFCNICNNLNDSYYSTLIYSAPNYLIINLNRGKGAIYECKVNFPELLNILNFVTYKEGITAFGLYAVICHLGPSSMNGHFVAYCRNRMDNKWYLYNDGMVSPCTKKNQYQDGMPYILFYKALREY